MRVLVTGAAGFVGSTLCDELCKRDVQVRAFVRADHSRDNLINFRGEFAEGDLLDLESLKRAVKDVDVIYHLAGTLFSTDRDGYFQGNQQGTRNLVEALKGQKVQRLVYVSSLAAAGPSSPTRPNLESDEPKPISFYGQSKRATELDLLALKEQLPITIVRPPTVYGPRDKATFSIFDTINKGIFPLLGFEDPDPKRFSFVHVYDLVQGLVHLGFDRKIPSGEIFYIAGEGEYSWEEFMRFISQAVGKKGFTVRIPIFVMKILAAISTVIGKITGKALPLNFDKVREMQAPAWSCSNAKIKLAVEFKPYWELGKGTSQTFAWYRNNGWL